MGKLVLYLQEGATRDVPLTKERVTIGRRADNDVCLPYPAVSGEHARVVTILADSFLEDLGSTNGTLVNGKAITKHFLADYDQIDVGRQRLTYVSNDEAKVEAMPPDLAREQMRGLIDKLAPSRPVPQVEVPVAGEQRLFGAARAGPGVVVVDLDREIKAGPTLGVPPPRIRIDDVLPPKPAAPALSVPKPALSLPKPTTTAPVQAAPAQPVPVAPSPPPKPKRAGPTVKVLSGASQGRIVPFPGPELTVGRVGVQVAIVRKVDAGFLLIPVEGKDPPRINGGAVSPEGSPLHPGDTFEVAGVRLELSVEI